MSDGRVGCVEVWEGWGGGDECMWGRGTDWRRLVRDQEGEDDEEEEEEEEEEEGLLTSNE